jgi:serine/threonine-protein kinase
MEYVEGADLSRLIKENGSLPYQEAAEYIRQSALGLQHAHQRGLIHRDIKPSNLLVSGERALPGTDGIAHVKILDMGLVRSILDDPVGTELTRDGTVVGTPDYMAPEQAKNSSKVDARADLYSLGCTLYYCLRAQPLFPEGSPIDKLLRHQLDPPPDIRKARPETPPGLAKVLEKLLKKNPNDRYQTATEVAVALQPFTAAADAGIVFAPAAEEPGGVQLDLPSGEAPPPVYDAEVITDVKPILTAEVLPAKPPAKPKKRESKRIVRPITASTDPNSGSMPGQDATRPAGTTPTRVARTPEATKSTTGRPVYPRSPAKQDPRKLWLAIGLTALAAVVLIGGAILLFSKFGSRTRASKSVERPALFVPNG